MAGFAGELILDKLSETMNSVRDFRVFTYALLARYPADREVGDSAVRCSITGAQKNDGAVASHRIWNGMWREKA